MTSDRPQWGHRCERVALNDDLIAPRRDEPWKVLWTRGQGCAHIADLLSDGQATKVEGDLKTACIAEGANVVVQAKSGSFDLASTVLLQSIDEVHTVGTVVGAVGTGPHSSLVAATTARLAAGLKSRAILVTMAREAHEVEAATLLVDEFAPLAPDAQRRVVQAEKADALVASLPSDALLVLGAPGGSWWQRQFFGPGRRLIHAAPRGSVVVRVAARRCFHSVAPLTPIGALMLAGDAASVISYPATPVVEAGRVIGTVRRSVLAAAAGSESVGSLMEAPVMAAADELVSSVGHLREQLEGAPLPIVDDDDRLLGGLLV